MKLFTKLALVSAIAMSGNAMAMQAMDDAALSSTTGQDGISIGIGISAITIDKVHVFDGDGLGKKYTPAGGVETSAAPGAIEINGIVVSAPMDLAGTALDTTRTLTATDHRFATLDIDTDGGDGKPFLNIAAKVSGLDISLGQINVTTASGTSGAYVAGTTGKAEILSGLSLKTGVVTANIQLGNTPQGAMIKLDGAMIGGLEIKDLAIKDASTAGGGYIAIDSIKLKDTDGSNLSLDTDVAVTKEGLAITAMKNAAGTDIYVKSIILGGGEGFTPKAGATPVVPGTGTGASSIGDIAISGMKVYNTNALGVMGSGAVITIAGH